MVTEVDVAIVGAGGAGLTVLHELALAAVHGASSWRVALVDDVDRLRDRPHDRTWCFWDRGDNPAEEALAASWRRAVVRSSGRDRLLDLRPFRYAMLRSPDYYRLVDETVRAARSRLDVVHLRAATEVVDGEPPLVRTPDGDVLAAWVLESRPAAPTRRAVTALAQSFRGAYVRTPVPVFHADAPVLMDFRTPQPERGLSFGYCLPLSATHALVEYTEFSPLALDEVRFDRALRRYVDLVAPTPGVVVEHIETGSIPMTDARYPRRRGRRVMLLGTAGGATRASTGYTFRTMQRQARDVVQALTSGREPLPRRPYPRRHMLMDGALLRALDRGYVDGPAFFCRLFARNPPGRVLDVLDGTSGPASEVALMATAPAASMVRAGAEAVLLRALPRRRRNRRL
ncbi:MAG: lycopene cyclase family protein [Actinomycetes bacterium]